MDTSASSAYFLVFPHTIHKKSHSVWFEIYISIQSQNKRVLGLQNRDK